MAKKSKAPFPMPNDKGKMPFKQKKGKRGS